MGMHIRRSGMHFRVILYREDAKAQGKETYLFLISHHVSPEIIEEVQQLVLYRISPVRPVMFARTFRIIMRHFHFQQFLMERSVVFYEKIFGTAVDNDRDRIFGVSFYYMYYGIVGPVIGIIKCIADTFHYIITFPGIVQVHRAADAAAGAKKVSVAKAE